MLKVAHSRVMESATNAKCLEHDPRIDNASIIATFGTRDPMRDGDF
jgi:hypothetical protein